MDEEIFGASFPLTACVSFFSYSEINVSKLFFYCNRKNPSLLFDVIIFVVNTHTQVGDTQATAYGQHCFKLGDACSVMGTGCFLTVNTGEYCHASVKGTSLHFSIFILLNRCDKTNGSGAVAH